MLLASLTFGGVCWAIVLVVGLFLTLVAFGSWITHGGIIGWWMANSMMELIGVILKALIECIASMRE